MAGGSFRLRKRDFEVHHVCIFQFLIIKIASLHATVFLRRITAAQPLPLRTMAWWR
jgi:hypothetical protein